MAEHLDQALRSLRSAVSYALPYAGLNSATQDVYEAAGLVGMRSVVVVVVWVL